MTRPSTASVTSRRTVVTAAGALGLTAALAACGSSDDDSGSAGYRDPGDAPAADSGGTGGEQPQEGGDFAQGGTELAKTSQIPEGGGMIFEDEKVVVTQPAAGDFKAFSAVCTHQGCAVGDISGGTINCPCHNSKFSIADGSVSAGPATQPLPAARIVVEDGAVKLA